MLPPVFPRRNFLPQRILDHPSFRRIVWQFWSWPELFYLWSKQVCDNTQVSFFVFDEGGLKVLIFVRSTGRGRWQKWRNATNHFFSFQGTGGWGRWFWFNTGLPNSEQQSQITPKEITLFCPQLKLLLLLLFDIFLIWAKPCNCCSCFLLLALVDGKRLAKPDNF